MRGNRAAALVALIALLVGACGSGPATTAPATAGPTRAAASAPASIPATAAPTGATVADTLQMHWLGNCTCIWHPAAYETFSQAINFELMFSTLIDRDWADDGRSWQPRGDLAESWEISPDGLTWTFHLRAGVTWHDGAPFTANDVAFTINRSLVGPIRFTRAAWDAIVGARDVSDGTAMEASGVKVIDDLTIALTIAAPNADYVSNLADPEAAIMPKHILEATDPATVETSEFATTRPIGTGPYRFIKYETDQYSQFEAYPDYFDGAPKIRNIFVKRLLGDQAVAQLESGDLHLSVRLNPVEQRRLEKVGTLDVLSTPGVGTFGPFFNMLRVTDVNCRRAVAYAVNAQGIVDTVFGGAGRINRGVIPGMPPADDQELFEYDPAKAKALVAACNSTVWTKSEPIRIVFDTSFPGVEQWLPIFAQDLEAAGFKTELLGFDTTAAIDYYNRIEDWEIIIAQGGDQGLGPFRTQNYYNCKLEDPARNKAYIRDCRIDELFMQARGEPDAAKRNEIFKQISGILNKAVDQVSFWTANALSAKTERLQGVTVPPNTREFIVGVQHWTLTP